MTKQTMTVAEAANYIGVSKDLIYQSVRENTIPNIKLGRRILFRKSALDSWMDQQESESTKANASNL